MNVTVFGEAPSSSPEPGQESSPTTVPQTTEASETLEATPSVSPSDPKGASDATYQVRITSVNGGKQTDSAAPLIVSQGDIVTLAVDLFQKGGDCTDVDGCPTSHLVEGFKWIADNRQGNECRPDEQKDCLLTSDFQVNDYGVSFYVPEDMSKEIRILVSHADSPTSTVLRLVPPDASVIAPPLSPQAVVTSPTPAAAIIHVYHFDRALLGMGRWVYMGGSRHWVPYTYQAQWVPYQNGYWTWVNNDGLTWVSYDPWGHITDHYGVWRHHGVYGWIWLPFPKHNYRPAVVTWIHTPTHIGWFPYSSDPQHEYRLGKEHGFTDGYWSESANVKDLMANTKFSPGITLVKNSGFAAKNIFDAKLALKEAVSFLAKHSGESRIGKTLGSPSLEESKKWVELRTKVTLPTTEKSEIKDGEVPLHSLAPVHPIPTKYQRITLGHEAKGAIPVGSMMVSQRGKAKIISPIKNGRSLNHPPQPTKGNTKPETPKTKSPSQPRKGHPYAERAKANAVPKGKPQGKRHQK